MEIATCIMTGGRPDGDGEYNGVEEQADYTVTGLDSLVEKYRQQHPEACCMRIELCLPFTAQHDAILRTHLKKMGHSQFA